MLPKQQEIICTSQDALNAMCHADTCWGLEKIPPIAFLYLPSFSGKEQDNLGKALAAKGIIATGLMHVYERLIACDANGCLITVYNDQLLIVKADYYLRDEINHGEWQFIPKNLIKAIPLKDIYYIDEEQIEIDVVAEEIEAALKTIQEQ